MNLSVAWPARSQRGAVYAIVVVIVSLCATARAAERRGEMEERVAVLASPSLHGVPHARQLAKVLALELAALHRNPDDAPRIIFFFADRGGAAEWYLPPEGKVFVDLVTPGPMRERAVYHVWIVTTPSLAAAARGMVMALNHAFNLKLDEAGMTALCSTVLRQQNASISAAELALH